MPEPFARAGCNCAACPFAKDGRPNNFVLPVGPNKPDGLLVIGGGPKREDIKKGEPLQGSTGQEMDAALLEAGIDRERLKIVNAWACMAKEPTKEVDERAAVNACRPLVQMVVGALPPETPTLLAGKWAMLSLTGREQGLSKTRGFIDANWKIGDKLKEDEE